MSEKKAYFKKKRRTFLCNHRKPTIYLPFYSNSSSNVSTGPVIPAVSPQVCCSAHRVADKEKPQGDLNLVKNGGFEVLDPGYHVFLNWYNRNNVVTFSSQAHEGVLAAMLSTAGPVDYGTGFLLQNVPALTGKRYQLTFFTRLLRSYGPLTDSQLRVNVYCTLSNTDLIGPIVIIDQEMSQTGYTMHFGTSDFAVPEGQSSLTVEFAVYRSTPKSVSESVQHWLVDSVSLLPV
ncbi:MAG: hypothetical protein PHC60_04300 [Heliobacteriaceae bacterium]|nr:hypothetical protein [Heliobacteriaceae bacterium]MDD4587600.1 hypothetical protein [Heliobacteriaceae bacterium]